MTINEKNKILEHIVLCLNKTSLLQIKFEEDGDMGNANKFRRRRNRLRVERDELLREILREWIGDAKTLTSRIRNDNKELDKAIKNPFENRNCSKRD